MTKIFRASMAVGKKIAKVRKEKSQTQEKLALKSGLNRAYIGYIERGERNASLETLEKIAKALGIKIKDLFTF